MTYNSEHRKPGTWHIVRERSSEVIEHLNLMVTGIVALKRAQIISKHFIIEHAIALTDGILAIRCLRAETHSLVSSRLSFHGPESGLVEKTEIS